MKPLLLGFLAFLGLRLLAFDDLTPISDEFDHSASLTNWSRIYQTEGWGNNALETIDINTSRPGHLLMRPHTSSWYAEWRGELSYKIVTNDFVITTRVTPRNRAGTSAPGSLYSLAGVMVRVPRAMTSPAQWTPNGQNYVFLSLGAASQPGTYQYEVKTTLNSISTLYISNDAPASATIQVARLGAHLIMLRRDENGSWRVHQRYSRSDFPAVLQAGLTVYTDWPICEAVGVSAQNNHVLTNGAVIPGYGTVAGANPDLVASFDYVRFARPQIPAELANANFSNPTEVSDAQLLAFLGDLTNVPGGAATAPELHEPAFHSDSGFSATIVVEPDRSYRVQVGTPGGPWTTLTNLISTSTSLPFLDPSPLGDGRFYRVVSP